jgi:tRNA A-37 threonylcarbamoyl transferase component Bud32
LEVVSVNPISWASTVKAKTVAGIVLGVRFAHRLGLLHGHLATSNIPFDSDHCIQIVDSYLMKLEIGENDNEERTQLDGAERLNFSEFVYRPVIDQDQKE